MSRNWLGALVMVAVVACGTEVRAQVARTPPPGKVDATKKAQEPDPKAEPAAEEPKPRKLEEATFGAGCFWCTEAVFERVKGVERVVSGFSGGQFANPSYDLVLTGQTGHAEVCQITFDSSVITFPELLEIFWKTHDPTTLNAQGPDFGTQYRSVVFYHTVEQKEQAEFYLRKLNEAGVYNSPVVTEVSPFVAFYPAEKYHQDYYRRNPRAEYCMEYIVPKVQKLRKVFKEKLKK